MKTQYKPIAMRCTQEHFESIIYRINLPIKDIGCFVEHPYLTNNFYAENVVSNVGYTNASVKREIIGTFDAEYFLDCCGREKPEEEVIFKGSEMEYRYNVNDEWTGCKDSNEYRLKPKPNLDADIAALQQKAKELGIKITITFE